MKHGVYSYQKRKCRCEECLIAYRGYLDRQSARRKKSDRVSVRLSGKALVDRVIADGRQEAVSRSTMSKWERFDLNIYAADRCACKLGYHPYEIWGDAFYAGTALSPTNP